MFCSKCGKELSNNAQFCSNCGAKVSGEKRSIDLSNISLDGFIGVNEVSGTIKRGLETLKHCKWMFLGTILGLIISLFFLGAEMFEVTYKTFWTNTESFTMFEDKAFLKVLFILAYIVSAGMLLLPLVTGKNWYNWNVYPALCVPAAAVVVLIFTMLGAKNGVDSSDVMQVVNATVKLSANGWLFIIINAVTIFLSIKVGLAIGEVQEARPAVEMEEEKAPVQIYWCAMCGEEGPFEDGCTKCGSHSKVYFKEVVPEQKK